MEGLCYKIFNIFLQVKIAVFIVFFENLLLLFA